MDATILVELRVLGDVLCSPARLNIVEELYTRSMSVKDMAALCELHTMSVRRHINVLLLSGIISKQPTTKRKQFYTLNPERFRHLINVAMNFATLNEKEVPIATHEEEPPTEEKEKDPQAG